MCVRDNERSLMSPVFFFLIKIFLIRVAEQEKVLTKQNLVSSSFERRNIRLSILSTFLSVLARCSHQAEAKKKQQINFL